MIFVENTFQARFLNSHLWAWSFCFSKRAQQRSRSSRRGMHRCPFGPQYISLTLANEGRTNSLPSNKLAFDKSVSLWGQLAGVEKWWNRWVL